jgi:hypothetical protein
VLLMALVTQRRHTGIVVGLGALALLFKHIVLFQVWTVFIYRWGALRGTLRFLCAGAIFLASFAPFARDGSFWMLQNVFFYAGAEATGWGL